MRSSRFNPERPQVRKPVNWPRVGAFFPSLLARGAADPGMHRRGCRARSCSPPLFTKDLIDDAIPSGSMPAVLIDVGGMVGSALFAGLLGVYQGYLNSLVGEGIMRDIRTSMVSHLHRMSLSFFTNTKTGEIMKPRPPATWTNVDSIVTGTFVTIVTNVATMVTTIVTIFILDWRLALLALVVVPLMILPLSPIGPSHVRDSQADARAGATRIESLTQETLSISGIVLMKSFVREPFEKTRFFRVCDPAHGPRNSSRDGRALVHRRNQRDGDHRAGAGVGGRGRGLAIRGGPDHRNDRRLRGLFRPALHSGLLARRRAGADRQARSRSSSASSIISTCRSKAGKRTPMRSSCRA